MNIRTGKFTRDSRMVAAARLRLPVANGSRLALIRCEPTEVNVQLVLREEHLRYRFLPFAETELTEGLQIASSTANEKILMNELSDQRKPANSNSTHKTKIEYGFLFQLSSTGQITHDQVHLCNDDPVHINQISARKVAVYRYSGAWSELRYKRMLQRFLFELMKNRVETTGDPIFTRRDSTNQFWTRRRNEIWLEVAR